jgi:hypothetical protein
MPMEMEELRVLTTEQVRKIAAENRAADAERPGDYMLGRLMPDAFHLARLDGVLPDGSIRAELNLRFSGRSTPATAYMAIKDWESLPTRNEVRRRVEREMAGG